MPQELAVVRTDWPEPAVVAEARIRADQNSLAIRYRTADGATAVVNFPSCWHVIFGQPNDEALTGHPLSGHGLEPYSVHEVTNSSLIATLERRNSVHASHSDQLFLGLTHYIFTFQDSTLECVVRESEASRASITICDTEAQANREWEAIQP